MAYAIVGLDPAPFTPLYGLGDAELAAHGAIRYIVDSAPGFPCRISLADANVGETALLLNHTFQPAANPYHGSHAIFVREGATERATFVDEVPESLRVRLVSLRAFDADDMMLDADVVDGADLDAAIRRMFAEPGISYLQAHNAKRGCFAARVERR